MQSVNMPYSDDRELLGWFCILNMAYNPWDDTDVLDSV